MQHLRPRDDRRRRERPRELHAHNHPAWVPVPGLLRHRIAAGAAQSNWSNPHPQRELWEGLPLPAGVCATPLLLLTQSVHPADCAHVPCTVQEHVHLPHSGAGPSRVRRVLHLPRQVQETAACADKMGLTSSASENLRLSACRNLRQPAPIIADSTLMLVGTVLL